MLSRATRAPATASPITADPRLAAVLSAAAGSGTFGSIRFGRYTLRELAWSLIVVDVSRRSETWAVSARGADANGIARPISGALAAADAVDGALAGQAELHGFLLATPPFAALGSHPSTRRIIDAGNQAFRAAMYLQLIAGCVPTAREARALQSIHGAHLRQLRSMTRAVRVPQNVVALYESGRIILTPGATAILQTGAQSTPQLQAALGHVLLHELQHAITPDAAGPKWLEEGIAETIASWPGANRIVLAHMGLSVAQADAADHFASSDYQRYEGAVQALLTAAGIDAQSSSSIARAVALLQGSPASAVPAKFAAAIASVRHLTPAQEQELTKRIARCDGNAGQVIAWLDQTAPVPSQPV